MPRVSPARFSIQPDYFCLFSIVAKLILSGDAGSSAKHVKTKPTSVHIRVCVCVCMLSE